MDFRVARMMLFSIALSVIGMCLGSILAGGHAIILLQFLFPFVVFLHSVMEFYGLVGSAVTIATGLVFVLGRETRTKVIMAIICVSAWGLIVYPLDKGYIK